MDLRPRGPIGVRLVSALGNPWITTRLYQLGIIGVTQRQESGHWCLPLLLLDVLALLTGAE